MIAWRNSWNWKIIFCWVLWNFAKGWYLCCYKYWRRNLNVYSIFILVKAAFFLEGGQRSSLINRKPNKQSKIDIWMKLTNNLITNNASSLWTRHYIKKIFVNAWIDTNSFLPFSYACILTDPASLLMAHLIIDNWMPPIYNFCPNIYYFLVVCVRNLKEQYNSMVYFKVSKWKSDANLFWLESGANYPESEKLCTIKKVGNSIFC